MIFQKTKKVVIATILLGIMIVPLISAYSWSWGYYRSPWEYLQNEWVMFIILLLIFFGVIFYTLNKAFKNKQIAAVVSLGLSLLISLAIAQRGLLLDYGGGGISSWILLIAILLGLGFLIRFANESFGRAGAIIAVIGIWLLMLFIDPYKFLPYSLLENYGFMSFYKEVLRSFFGLIIFVIIAVVLSSGRNQESVGEQLVNSLFRRGRR